MTDGPVIRIAIDVNGNGRIDPTDIPMGGIYEFAKERSSVKVIVKCLSTPEFGPIEKIDLYVGAQPTPSTFSTTPVAGRTYAAFEHGVAEYYGDPNGEPAESYISPNGHAYRRMFDGYWRDDSLQTRAPEGEYDFTISATLDLDLFEVGRGVTTDRFFVRAFVSSRSDVMRYGLSNPIWLLRK